MKARCPECGGTRAMGSSSIIHVRSCSQAFSSSSRIRTAVQLELAPPPAPKLNSITGTEQPVNEMRRQADRESNLRRAIRGACPRVPFGFVSAMAHECIKYDLQLEAEGKVLS